MRWTLQIDFPRKKGRPGPPFPPVRLPVAAAALFIVAALVCEVVPAPAAATTDTIRISARTEKTEYRIGDKMEYVVTVEWRRPVEFIRIEPSLELGVFEILRSPEVKEKKLGRGWRREEYRYFLSTFETGEFTIPAFTVVYRGADGKEKRVPTPPVKIRVNSVAPLAPGKEEIRPAKPPLVPPRRMPPPAVLAAIAVALLLLLIAALLAVREMRKRRAGPVPVAPPRPIEEVAREELACVAESDLLAQGQIKEYFDRISDIIRFYLGRRYGFKGIVTTTSELLAELRAHTADERCIALVEDFSEQADLAKFAKWKPDRAICERFLETAYRIIDETTPRPAETEGEGEVELERASGTG